MDIAAHTTAPSTEAIEKLVNAHNELAYADSTGELEEATVEYFEDTLGGIIERAFLGNLEVENAGLDDEITNYRDFLDTRAGL